MAGKQYRAGAADHWASVTVGGALVAATRTQALLVTAIGIYVILPFFDVPFLPISWSAPLIALLAVDVARQSSRFKWHDHAALIQLAGIYTLAVIVSYFTGLLGSSDATTLSAVLLGLRLPYWVLSMVLVAVVVAQTRDPGVYVRGLGWAVVGLGLIRLFGAVTGLGHRGVFTFGLAQNVYGFTFSTFWPCALVLIFKNRSEQLVGMIAVAALGIAAIANGSRSSWVAIAVTTVLFLIVSVALGHDKLRMVMYLGAAGGIVLLVAVGGFARLISRDARVAVLERFDSFENLEMDKSYQIRIAMRRKALKLFRENIVLGVGPGRFNNVTTEFDLPDRLRHASFQELNEKSAHSGYFQHLAETGLLGTVPFGVLLGFLAYRGARATQGLLAIGLVWPLGIVLGFVGISIHLITVSALMGTQAWFVYGLVAGLIVWEERYRRWRQSCCTEVHPTGRSGWVRSTVYRGTGGRG